MEDNFFDVKIVESKNNQDRSYSIYIKDYGYKVTIVPEDGANLYLSKFSEYLKNILFKVRKETIETMRGVKVENYKEYPQEGIELSVCVLDRISNLSSEWQQTVRKNITIPKIFTLIAEHEKLNFSNFMTNALEDNYYENIEIVSREKEVCDMEDIFNNSEDSAISVQVYNKLIEELKSDNHNWQPLSTIKNSNVLMLDALRMIPDNVHILWGKHIPESDGYFLYIRTYMEEDIEQDNIIFFSPYTDEGNIKALAYSDNHLETIHRYLDRSLSAASIGIRSFLDILN